MTNLQSHYSDPRAFPPFGLSDHVTLLVSPRIRRKSTKSEKYIFKRDTRPSRKAELGWYLGSPEWSLLLMPANTCDQLESVFRGAITTGLDILMSFKSVRINTKDTPWRMPELKTVIMKRQRAFHHQGADSIQFKFYRNAVNRTRKRCKAQFYESKVQCPKCDDPKRR